MAATVHFSSLEETLKGDDKAAYQLLSHSAGTPWSEDGEIILRG